MMFSHQIFPYIALSVSIRLIFNYYKAQLLMKIIQFE